MFFARRLRGAEEGGARRRFRQGNRAKNDDLRKNPPFFPGSGAKK